MPGKSKPAPTPKGSPKSRAEHMARRAKHMPQKAVGGEFGKSQATVSRTLRQGFTREGAA